MAIALLRLDESVDFLLPRMSEDSQRAATDALRALAVYSRDENIRVRVQSIVAERPELRDAFEREFQR